MSRKKAKRNNIIVIDCGAICHAAKHSMKGLSYDEQETGVIFGFLNRLLTFQKRFKPIAIIFAWDSKRSKRSKVFPGYKDKSNTDKTEDDKLLERITYPQFNELRRRILPSLGFENNFICTGYEADDIIAKIVFDEAFLFCPECDVIIITRDNDLLQLLGPNVSLFDPQTKKIITADKFMAQYGITPSQWSEVKAIGGCTSDTVPGVKGVAEITAIKYITGSMNKDTKTYKRIIESDDIIKRNRILVRLPYDGVKVPEIKKGTSIDFHQFNEICTKYGFSSFLKKKKYNDWKTAFGEKRFL